MSVNQYINGKLNLIAGGYGSGGGECGCEENTFTGTMEEVQAAIAAGEIKDDFIIFVTDDFEEISSDNKIEYVTQEEYDALPESKLTDNVEYRITDKGIDSVSASNVTYDGSASGLSAMNVQGAVDELKDSLEIEDVISRISLVNGAKLFNDINNSLFVKVGHVCIFNLQLDTSQLTSATMIQLPPELCPRGCRIQFPAMATDAIDGQSYIVWITHNGMISFAGEKAYPKRDFYIVVSGTYTC